MRIWLLTSELPPTVPGGIGRYVANAAEMLAGAGHEVTVLAADTDDGEERTPAGAHVIRFAPRGRLLRPREHSRSATHPAYPYNVIAHWPALSYEIAERAAELAWRSGALPDVIECQEYNALPYFLLQRRLLGDHPLAQVPVLVHMHSPDFCIARANEDPRYRLPRYWIGQMEKFGILAADGLLAPSRFLRDEVERELPQARGRIEVLPLPYPPLNPRPARPTPGDLVYFGRLEHRKGVLPLAEACARLWRRGVEFRLTLIGGDTHFAPRARTIGAELRARHEVWVERGALVIHDAPLAPPALFDRLASAWAVLIPSLWENFPNTCIEAMALGRPVVVSTAGGQAEMVGDDGRAGLVFSWDTPGGCEDAIARVLALSETEAQAMGALARERIAGLTSFSSVLPQRLAHYQQLIDGFRPRSVFPCVTPGLDGNVAPLIAGAEPGVLSVVIPFYNLGAYIEETVASVLASGYRPLEVLIVDDGSDDPASLVALERVAQRHGGLVRMMRTEHVGVGEARNIGAEAARGELLAFVDADDLVAPTFFARGAELLRRYENVSFVSAWVQFFGAWDDVWPAWGTELPYLLAQNLTTVLMVIRRADFLAYGRNSPAMVYALEDYEALIAMAAQGCIGISIPEPLVRYRLRPGSRSRMMNEEQALYLRDLIAGRHVELYRRFGPELFGLLSANGSPLRWDHPAVPVPQQGDPGLRIALRTAAAKVWRRLRRGGA